MMQGPPAIASQEQTRAAIAAMHAYFDATARAQSRRERQYLAHEWLAAIRRLRTVDHQDG
ncbi:MAG: hypothetical protein KDJ70_01790 [Candidatus Competibacteraceae bacterium]|nr:hypothetical protein [Candidatus Competibacteraceae bacterium]